MMPQQKKKNVYELTSERLDIIFKEFDNVYVSFSGGKDSGIILNMCIEYIRRNGLKKKIGVFHMDYEVQYNNTLDYLDHTFKRNSDILEIYRICVPFKVSTCTSMFQSFWRPWDDDAKELWVRKLPHGAYTKDNFPFYNEDMWDYEFQVMFSKWLHDLKKAKRTCCLIGIRTQESLNRWRAVHYSKMKHRYCEYPWTHMNFSNIYNAYPIFDWLTTDVWTANGKFKWDYNRLYDLYHKAGVRLEKQRVASPFISAAQESLALYKAIDPDMWGKMICRVNGVNFIGIYGGTTAVGRYRTRLPEGYTWERYMHFLLSTLPEEARNNYVRKLNVSQNFWRNRGGCLSELTIRQLKQAGVKMEILNASNYNTSKHPVRMEYMDDIDISDFKQIPTYKRMCVCILKNDHSCKYMGFAQNKYEKEQKDRVMELYKSLFT